MARDRQDSLIGRPPETAIAQGPEVRDEAVAVVHQARVSDTAVHVGEAGDGAGAAHI